MHEWPPLRHPGRDRMRLQIFYFRLIVVLALTSLCNVLHAASPQPTAADLQQQQQAPAKNEAPPDSAQQSPPSEEALSLSDQIIQDVLEPLRAGMESQDVKQIMSIFDKEEMSNYGDVEQQMHAFFGQYQSVRFRYQVLQATAQNDHASATAELDVDALPYEVSIIPARRSVQMRFQLKQEPKGWRVLGFSPADFFSVGNFSRTNVQ
jgi:hypothetical protein